MYLYMMCVQLHVCLNVWVCDFVHHLLFVLATRQPLLSILCTVVSIHHHILYYLGKLLMDVRIVFVTGLKLSSISVKREKDFVCYS